MIAGGKGHAVSDFVRPRVVVSKCLGFAACRYNGAIISDDFVARLKDFAALVPVCPEMEIGLGCPRDPIRVLSVDGKRRLVQPSTGRDVTDDMRSFAARFLEALGGVDGFILKSRSPSCGTADTKIFGGMNDDEPIDRGPGFFAAAVLERFPDLPVEDELRLGDEAARERFLKRACAAACGRTRWRADAR
jgi:uncharacterized protein YbbK (DUF523 family)